MHATAVSTAWRHQAYTRLVHGGMPHAETPCGLEPASGSSPALTAISQAPAQTRRCAVAVHAAARSSAWGDVQYAAAPKQHVVLDAQQVAEKHHLYASLGPCSTSALHPLHQLLRAARVEICQKLPGRSRGTCASVRDRSHPHAGHHISATACAGRDEAGAHRLRAVSLRLGSLVLRQPAS